MCLQQQANKKLHEPTEKFKGKLCNKLPKQRGDQNSNSLSPKLSNDDNQFKIFNPLLHVSK